LKKLPFPPPSSVTLLAGGMLAAAPAPPLGGPLCARGRRRLPCAHPPRRRGSPQSVRSSLCSPVRSRKRSAAATLLPRPRRARRAEPSPQATPGNPPGPSSRAGPAPALSAPQRLPGGSLRAGPTAGRTEKPCGSPPDRLRSGRAALSCKRAWSLFCNGPPSTFGQKSRCAWDLVVMRLLCCGLPAPAHRQFFALRFVTVCH